MSGCLCVRNVFVRNTLRIRETNALLTAYNFLYLGFHIGPFVKPERRQLPEAKARAVIDRGLDMQADMKTAVL